MQLITGLIFGAIIATLAWKAKALSQSGAWAAAITGGLVFGLGGLPWAVLLLAFFVSSSGLSRAFARRKASLSEKFSKGSQRDWAQVAANGGLGALLAIGHALFPDQAWPWLAFAGAMAAVNADTWATELGVLNSTPPRLITTFQPVERGASGAISLMGSLAALGGAALIACLAALLSPWAAPANGIWWQTILIVTLAGAGGSFFDSLLGATVQSIYYCRTCQKETERHPVHICGTPTTHQRGWLWMDNDVVNGLASLAGALLSAIF